MTNKRSLTTETKTRITATSTLFLSALTLLIALAAPAIAQNPVPFVDQPLVPDATAPGGSGFTLTVNGAGFVAGSVVNWNGTPRATVYVSNHQLTATILASDIATASTAAVTVVDPYPGGVSNAQPFSVAVAKTSVSFEPAATYGSGGIYPGSLLVADVNGDGKPDIVVGNGGGDTSVGVLLGNGDGTFQPVLLTYIASMGENNSVAVADVNGDGKPDLIVATCCQSNGDAAAAVLLGNGDGTFQAPLFYDAGGSGSVLVVADVNGDGKPDIVVTNYNNSNNSTVSVLLGNGNGTFQPALISAAPDDAATLIVADVNGDGKPDVLIYGNSIGVLLGNGDGTFQSATYYHGGYCSSVAIADVNGDAIPDLVTANAGLKDCGPNAQGFAGILLGNGDSTFQPVVDYLAINYTNGGVGDVAVADLNGDDKPDVMVTSGTQLFGTIPGTVGVLLGNGNGTFQTAVTFQTGGTQADAAVAADLNNDGRPDIVVANWGQSTLGVLLNNTASSETPTTTTLSASPNPSVYGQSVTFTATVTSSAGTPNGNVELYNGSTVVGSATLTGGKTSISISSLPAASDSITAAYLGGGNFASSTSSPLIQTVSAATTSISLTSSINPADTYQSVTFTAVITSQFGGALSGSVVFYSGLHALGTGQINGDRATLTTSFSTSGTYSISAKYNGDGNNSGSTSAALGQAIFAATTTALNSSLNPSIVGQAVTFTATVTSTGGTPPNGETVTFYNGSAVLGTASLTGGNASLTTSSLPVGIFTMTASYPGDSTFAASVSPGERQTVNAATKSPTTTTLVSSLNPSIFGQKVTWTATVTPSGTGAPTGKVKFTWSIFTIGSATLNSTGVATLTLSKLNADSYPLTANYQGDANNSPSSSTVLNQVINQTTSAATLTSSPNPSSSGEAVTFTAKITSPTTVPTGPVTFSAGNTVLGSVELSGGKATFTTSALAVGSNTITVTYPWNSDVSGSSASVTQAVDQ